MNLERAAGLFRVLREVAEAHDASPARDRARVGHQEPSVHGHPRRRQRRAAGEQRRGRGDRPDRRRVAGAAAATPPGSGSGTRGAARPGPRPARPLTQARTAAASDEHAETVVRPGAQARRAGQEPDDRRAEQKARVAQRGGGGHAVRPGGQARPRHGGREHVGHAEAGQREADQGEGAPGASAAASMPAQAMSPPSTSTRVCPRVASSRSPASRPLASASANAASPAAAARPGAEILPQVQRARRRSRPRRRRSTTRSARTAAPPARRGGPARQAAVPLGQAAGPAGQISPRRPPPPRLAPPRPPPRAAVPQLRAQPLRGLARPRLRGGNPVRQQRPAADGGYRQAEQADRPKCGERCRTARQAAEAAPARPPKHQAAWNDGMIGRRAAATSVHGEAVHRTLRPP